MNINDAYPSKYLGAADLGGRPATVKIDTVQMEVLDRQKKMILTFVGKRKAFVCNKTNAKKIAEILRDDETDRWVDQLIELYPAEVEFQGDTVEAIRVRAPRTETRSQDRGEARREPPRDPPRDDRRDERGGDFGRGGGTAEMTRAHDREVDDRPPPRQAARNQDMDDDIPF